MITEELFSSLVYQACSDPAASRIGSYTNFYNTGNSGNSRNDNAATQQQRHLNPSVFSRALLLGSSCSPLDYPELLMAYQKFSCNTLLRYHYNVPFLQPRAAYSLSRRVSPTSVAHPRMHPSARFEAVAFAPPPAGRASPSRAYGHHEDTVSPSAEAMYNAEFRRPTRTSTAAGDRARGVWGGGGADNVEHEDCVIAVSDRFSSLSPRQLCYRHTSSSSNGRPRAGSGVSFDTLNHAGFCYDEDDDDVEDDKNNRDCDVDEDEMMMRPTGRLDSRFAGGREDELASSASSNMLLHTRQTPQHNHRFSHHQHHHHHHRHSNGDIVRRQTVGRLERMPMRVNASIGSEREIIREEEVCEQWMSDDDEFLDSRSALQSTLRGEEDV